MEERPIIRLSEEIIGKIAAGEVVESPASAIKELIENSLDAGANCITVEIRDGGISYLRVTDNGRGIPSKDVRLAFERHATSKIRKSEDLFDLRTLGFRGEALTSIAAVSKLTLTTRNAKEETGTKAVNEGGIIKSITDAASPQGTTIVSRDLFYNTPVRLKFLKKPVTEASKVADMVAKLILAHPDIAFRLIHNGKQVYSSSGNGDLRSAVFCLYGRETANEMVPVRSEGAISVSGLVGVGAQARSNRGRQTFIVNGRTIRNHVLTQALEEGCRERVTVGHYPICVLNIQLPVSMVDVNVHPNKLEVRFSDERLIYQHVAGAVADAFHASKLEGAPSLSLVSEEKTTAPVAGVIRVIDTDSEEGKEQARQQTASKDADADEKKPQISVVKISTIQTATERGKEEVPPAAEKKPDERTHAAFTSFVTEYFGGAALRESTVPGKMNKPLGFMPLEPEKQAPAERPKEDLPAKTAEETDRKEESKEEIKDAPKQAQEQKEEPQLVQERIAEIVAPEKEIDPLQGYQMIGIAFDTYIILQNDKQMIFVDQHAAHERILYEKLMREIDRGTISQVLMVPQVVHVTPQEAEKIEQFSEEIRSAGFDFEPFGEQTYQLRAVPNILGVPQSRSAFLDLIDRLGELRTLSTQKKRRDAILQMACKKAIKAGDKLSMEEIRPLLADMIAADAPMTCPHGRPLVITLSRSEIEKRFRRINN